MICVWIFYCASTHFFSSFLFWCVAVVWKLHRVRERSIHSQGITNHRGKALRVLCFLGDRCVISVCVTYSDNLCTRSYFGSCVILLLLLLVYSFPFVLPLHVARLEALSHFNSVCCTPCYIAVVYIINSHYGYILRSYMELWHNHKCNGTPAQQKAHWKSGLTKCARSCLRAYLKLNRTVIHIGNL